MPATSRPTSRVENPKSKFENWNILVLAGGVGGSKLADGLAQVVPPQKLTIVVNTGDDFQHLGLTICPDLDTVMYTLAGVANPDTGWGRVDETWRTITEVGRLGGQNWFKVGDLDLATHLIRSQMLAEGHSLTEASQHLCRKFAIDVAILPMSDQPAPTLIATDEGLLPFQNWFVKRKWQPAVKEVRLPEDVRITPQVAMALENSDLILIAPSNPFVSIDPILNVYPIRAMVSDLPEVVVAVSPIIAGEAVKGPAAKMMGELGLKVSSTAIARYYGNLIDVFIHDQRDEIPLDLPEIQGPGQANLVRRRMDTLMRDRADRRRLAQQILDFIAEHLDS